MKSVSKHLLKGCVLFIFLLLQLAARSQGRVVVNEFMAWSGCSTTSEFIELLNFGPGPVNIGCYIVTNGQFAVTIPANTVLKAGEYYVLAGQDILARGCGNADSAVVVDLNWSTCGCTDKPVPSSGDGFLKDGGGANEKVVLLDAVGNVLDAVSRSSNPSASDLLTSAGGACAPRTFDLDHLPISYESIGIATGVDNSFARRVDGDCGWVKTTAISAGAPNKTGSTASATYDFTTISASECDSTAGRVSIQVSAPSVTSLFPMSYILGYDRDSNGVFDNSDVYLHGVDSSAPSIDVRNLAYGRYRITVASALGCNLKTYDFFIFNCYGIVLPLKLTSFTYEGLKGEQHSFIVRFADVDGLKELQLEGAGDDGVFHAVDGRVLPLPNGKSFQILAPPAAYRRYRLKVIEEGGRSTYSVVVTVPLPSPAQPRSWPNPVSDRLFVSVQAVQRGAVRCTVMDASGKALQKSEVMVTSGVSTVFLPVHQLGRGVYYLRLEGAGLENPLTLRFVK